MSESPECPKMDMAELKLDEKNPFSFYMKSENSEEEDYSPNTLSNFELVSPDKLQDYSKDDVKQDHDNCIDVKQSEPVALVRKNAEDKTEAQMREAETMPVNIVAGKGEYIRGAEAQITPTRPPPHAKTPPQITPTKAIAYPAIKPQTASSHKEELKQQLTQMLSWMNPLKGTPLKSTKIPSSKLVGRPNKTITGSKKGQDTKMMSRMGFQRKRENYTTLRDWDRRRAQVLALHNAIVENLQTEIDKRIKASIENFQIYVNFIRERVKKEEKYLSVPVLNTKFALQNNALAKSVYINCSVVLNSLSEENNERCIKVQQFISVMKEDILRQVADEHLNRSQKELLRIRQRISSLKTALQRCNGETESISEQLAQMYNDGEGGSDFYLTQMRFLQKANEQSGNQKKLGEYCLEYYLTAVKQQRKRSDALKEILLRYSRANREAYGKSGSLSKIDDDIEVEQMSKQVQYLMIDEFYALEDMFDSRTLQVFWEHSNSKKEHSNSKKEHSNSKKEHSNSKKEHQNADIKLEQLSKFLKEFNFEQFDYRRIFLKEFEVVYLGKEEQKCSAVITVDNYLHLTYGQQLHAQPNVSFKIEKKALEVRMGKGETVQIVKKEQRKGSVISYFWDQKNEKISKIKFRKQDSKEEFLEYIGKLIDPNLQ